MQQLARRSFFGLVLAVALLAAAAPAQAQLVAPNASGVAMGHVHLIVREVATHRKFWSDLGGTPVKNGTLEMVQFPGVFILLRQGTPTGGSVGSTVNHIGFHVKDIKAALAKWRAAGITAELTQRPDQAWIVSPDDVRVEILENTALATPMAFHHIHLQSNVMPEMRAWYVKTFGAEPGKRGAFETAELPGVSVSMMPSDTAMEKTAGRSVDHIGFEIKGLEAFIKKLEASGIKMDRPYTTSTAAPGTHIAFFTDPWGTQIELTENLSPR